MCSKMKFFLCLFLSFCPIFVLFGQKTDPNIQAIELGEVSWHRNYDEAVKKAKILNKPIFILFQEVPGCATCQNYGKNVLSHPIIVDAIENEFIPLTIFNNKSGADKQILEKFKEPSWNNPVVRIIYPDGKDILKRHSGIYSPDGLVSYMQTALMAFGEGRADYLDLLMQELESKPKNQKNAYFKMYCFWSGEAALGKQEGVIATQPGFMNGYEVVKVTYDTDQINEKQIAKKVKSDKIMPIEKTGSFRKDKDPQYYLKNSTYRYLALTDLQKTKINSAIADKSDPLTYLSPSQKRWLKNVKKHKKEALSLQYDQPFKESWKKCKKSLEDVQ